VDKLLQTVVGKFQRVFIVIGALDECNIDTRDRLLNEIANLRTHQDSSTSLFGTLNCKPESMEKFADSLSLECVPLKLISEDTYIET